MGEAGGKAYAMLGWLPAVVAADARRFRTTDERLRATLVDAGGELTASAPDVEIAAAAAALHGDAHEAIVVVDCSQPEGGRLARRAPRRLLATGQARAHAAAERRALRRRGYADSATVLWDIDHLLYVPGVRDSRRRRPLAELLPQRALVIGARDPRGPTLLEAVAAEAGEVLGERLDHGWPLARPAMVVAVGSRGVLRIAVGPGRRIIDQQQAALQGLADADPPSLLADRLPWALARGRTGLADWSLDARLRGTPSGARLSRRLLGDCLEFLVALHRADGAPPASRVGIGDAAAVVAGACAAADDAERVRALGQALDARLEDLPRGFGHRDFWTRNLLTDADRLTGVVDWDGAGPGRLPLLDLLHLRLTARLERTRGYLGDGVVGHLLPWAAAGGDGVAAAYAERIGFSLDRPRLEALVLAYWLDRVAFEIGMFADSAAEPLWLRRNVDGVVAALEQSGHLAPG